MPTDLRVQSVETLKAAIAEPLRELMLGHADVDTTHARMMEFIAARIGEYRVDEQYLPAVLSTRWNHRLDQITKDMDAALYEALQEVAHQGWDASRMARAAENLMRLLEDLSDRLIDEGAIQAERILTFAALQAFEIEGYELFRFQGGQGPRTCEKCGAHIGNVYRLQELVDEEVIPPLHPNCRC